MENLGENVFLLSPGSGHDQINNFQGGQDGMYIGAARQKIKSIDFNEIYLYLHL